MALATNIRLGWKSLSETNTLAYYENTFFTTVISFMVQAPGVKNARNLLVSSTADMWRFLMCDQSMYCYVYGHA
jgi:hypothetical protein